MSFSRTHTGFAFLFPKSIKEFLQGLKLECYLIAFLSCRFDTLDTLQDLTPEDFKKMEVMCGHQGKILCKAKEIISKM